MASKKATETKAQTPGVSGKTVKKVRTALAASHRPKKTAETTSASILQLADAVAPRQLSPEELATRAYFHWLERGCPNGSAEEDWFRAEEELRTSQ